MNRIVSLESFLLSLFFACQKDFFIKITHIPRAKNRTRDFNGSDAEKSKSVRYFTLVEMIVFMKCSHVIMPKLICAHAISM